MDPMTIAAAVTAFSSLAKFIASLKDSDVTPEQLPVKKAAEDVSRQTFDEYVAKLGG